MTVTTAAPAIDGADLLDDICAFVREHVKLDEEAIPLIALWIAFSWVAPQSYFQPRLAITSPEPGCGKTTLLRLLELLVCNPLSASNITTAALFRIISLKRPTVLIDEADTFLDGNEELRGIINAGFERPGAVTRCVGNDNTPTSFPVASALAIAAIGSLPGTIMDRSIVIEMRRKETGDTLKSLRVDRPTEASVLKERLATWAKEIEPAFQKADPHAMPPLSSDRAADKLRPLIALADLAGDHWPRIARLAAAAHDRASARTKVNTDGVLLLSDIRNIWAESSPQPAIRTADLIKRLVAIEEAPWSEFAGPRRPLNAHLLARLLRPYGIHSSTIRFMDGLAKGYRFTAFEDAFRRYLPPSGASP